MLELKNPKIAVPVVLFAGILWSFGPLVVDIWIILIKFLGNIFLEEDLTIFIILNLYLYFEEGIKFWKNYLKIGKSGILGGSGLGIAMISFIYSITNTTAAITLLCLAAMPFFTALISIYFFKRTNFIKCLDINFYCNNWNNYYGFWKYWRKFFIGFIFGITSSIGFSVFSVTLRWRKETPKFTTVAFAGLFCFVFATIMILIKGQVFFSSSYNSSLFSLHGTLVCLGLILYSIGSKAIPAAELTLLSLTEVIGGIFWVWLPLFGINEVPDTNTIIGGFFYLYLYFITV
jgi:drug/metabolite transporter (DMT)-like permease